MSLLAQRRALSPTGPLAAVVAVALLSACGTTVPTTASTSSAYDALGSGLGPSPAGGTEAATTGAGSSATGSSPVGPSEALGSTGMSPGTGASPAAPAGGGSQSPVRSAGNVPGMTSTDVKIGVERVDTAALGAFASAAGTDAAIGDLNGFQDALIAWVNRTGGLASRKLTPVFFQADVSASNQQNNSARCATWAEDNRVFAAQAAYYQGGGAVPCLAKRGVVSIATLETAPGSADDFTRYSPYYYAPSAMETVSLARSYVTGLHQAGFFTPADSIGLLYFDFPEFEVAKERGLEPALARHGLEVSSEYAIAYNGNPSELGSITAAVANAQLKFASEGITNVLFLDAGGTLALFFMQQAQNQGASFRYGLNSTTYPAFLEGQGVSSQLARATVAGVQPARDTNDVASAPPNADRDRCFAILKAAGHSPRSSVDRQAMTGYCSFYFFLKASFDRARSYDPRGFAAAVAGLGTSPGTAAGSIGDDFSAGMPWGSARYAIARWRTGCSCFTYERGSFPA